MEKLSTKIQGMSCTACASGIEKHLENKKGLQDIRVYFSSSLFECEYDAAQISLQEIAQYLKHAGGYTFETETLRCALTEKLQKQLETINQNKALKGILRIDCRSGFVEIEYLKSLSLKQIQDVLGISEAFSEKKTALSWDLETIRLGLCLGLSLAVLVLSMGIDLAGWVIPFGSWILWALATPVQLFGGWPFFKRAFYQLKTFKTSMDTLVSFGTSSVYTYSVLITVGLLDGPLYYEASSLVISLVSLGKYLESRATKKTGNAVKKMLDLQATKALKVSKDGQETEVRIQTLKQSDQVRVRPGEKIPVDGQVLEGRSYVDESMFTGEAKPVKKQASSPVLAGSLNEDGLLLIQVQKLSHETLLSQMIHFVEKAQGSKLKVQRVADKVASVFAWIIFSLGFATFVLWWFMLQMGWVEVMAGQTQFSQSLYTMVSVLSVACACAMGLAVPTAIIISIGELARRGVLVKEASILEGINKIDTVVLDKTGTLTQGILQVGAWKFVHEHENIWPFIGALEQGSSHPIAKAIVRKAKQQHSIPVLQTVQQFKENIGRGVQGLVAGKSVLVGNRPFMQEQAIQINQPSLASWIEQQESLARTVVYIVINNTFVGALSVFDTLLEETPAALKTLKAKGLNLYMLTGDTWPSALGVAKQLDLDPQCIQASVLPTEKVDFIQKLQAQGKKIMMVGDGINDAPSLAQANVGIAVAHSTDIAKQASGLTLVHKNLNAIADIFNLGRDTVQTIHQNLFFAFIYNVVMIPLAVAGLLNPMLAGISMALSSLCVVFNSLRFQMKYRLKF